MARKDDDAKNWTPGDMIRDQAELDDVHVRAYNPRKDNILDQVWISEAEGGKTEAQRVADRVDAEAKRRGRNISAQVVPDRRGYKVITYTPKKK